VHRSFSHIRQMAPICSLICGSLGPCKSAIKGHVNQFSHFCRNRLSFYPNSTLYDAFEQAKHLSTVTFNVGNMHHNNSEMINSTRFLESTSQMAQRQIEPFLPREAMLSAVYAVVVCLCVCLSHCGIVSKRLNVGSRKQRRTIAP